MVSSTWLCSNRDRRPNVFFGLFIFNEFGWIELDLGRYGGSQQFNTVPNIKWTSREHFYPVYCEFVKHIEIQSSINETNGKRKIMNANLAALGWLGTTEYVNFCMWNIFERIRFRPVCEFFTPNNCIFFPIQIDMKLSLLTTNCTLHAKIVAFDRWFQRERMW